MVVDTETGGLSSDRHSILSLAGVVWEPKQSIKLLFDFYIREEEVITTKRALEVNKIDLNTLKDGLTPVDAVKTIKRSLDKHFGHDRSPVTLVGHNISFDVGFIKRLYRFAQMDYYADFRDRAIDTASILSFFMIAGKIKGNRASADVLFEATDTKIEIEDRHTAKGDAIATAKAIDALILTI